MRRWLPPVTSTTPRSIKRASCALHLLEFSLARSAIFRAVAGIQRSAEGEVDPALLWGQCVEMTFEILGVVVDKIHDVCHEFAKRQFRAEAGHDGEPPGVPARQNPQRPDRFWRPFSSRHRLPQDGALFCG